MEKSKSGCNLYVDIDIEREELISKLSEFLGASVKGLYVENFHGYICVDKNDEFDCEMRKDKDDGFLYYQYLLEVEPSPELDKQNQIGLVSKILHFFWSKGYPAVASCDYEELLPNKGGYKNPNVPKPQ